MQKNIFIFIIIFSISIYSVNAEYKEKLYGNFALSGDSIQIKNTTFKITFSKTDRIAISIDDSSGFIISKGLCETKWPYEVCFDSTNISHHNYATDRDIYKAYIRIYGFLANIDIKKESSLTKVSIGDLITLTDTIKNTGSNKATDIKLIDELPKEFIIIGLSPDALGCFISENKTILEGILDIDETKKCVYTLKAIKNSTFELKSSLTYFNGKDQVKAVSSSILITVLPLPLHIETKLSKDTIELGDIFNSHITLKNTDKLNLIDIISFEIEIPIGLKIVTLPNRLKQDYRKFTWAGKIELDEDTTFGIELSPEKFGAYNLTYNIIYFIKEKRYEIKNSMEIIVNPPKPVVNIKSDKTNYAESETGKLLIEISNPSERHSLHDVKLTINSTMSGFEEYSEELGVMTPKKSIVIDKIKLGLPDKFIDKQYIINFNLGYITNNQKFTEKSQYIIPIRLSNLSSAEIKINKSQEITNFSKQEKKINLTAEKSIVEVPVPELEVNKTNQTETEPEKEPIVLASPISRAKFPIKKVILSAIIILILLTIVASIHFIRAHRKKDIDAVIEATKRKLEKEIKKEEKSVAKFEHKNIQNIHIDTKDTKSEEIIKTGMDEETKKAEEDSEKKDITAEQNEGFRF